MGFFFFFFGWSDPNKWTKFQNGTGRLILSIGRNYHINYELIFHSIYSAAVAKADPTEKHWTTSAATSHLEF